MLSSELEICLNEAFQGARDARHEFMTVEHLLLAIIDTPKVREILRACGADATHVVALVEEGVLEPAGGQVDQWTFSGPALKRARTALRLLNDLELGVSGTALVLDLLDEIESLRSRLRRAGAA